MFRSPRAALSLRATGAFLLAICMPLPALATDAAPWVLAGRQGVIRMVIVPPAQAQDRAAYDQQIAAEAFSNADLPHDPGLFMVGAIMASGHTIAEGEADVTAGRVTAYAAGDVAARMKAALPSR